MYERQYDSCVILPERFDKPLSDVRLITKAPAQLKCLQVGAGPCKLINYA